MMPHLHFSPSIAIPGLRPILHIPIQLRSSLACPYLCCLPLPSYYKRSPYHSPPSAWHSRTTSINPVSWPPPHPQFRVFSLVLPWGPYPSKWLHTSILTLHSHFSPSSVPPRTLPPICLTGIHHNTLHSAHTSCIPYPSASSECLFWSAALWTVPKALGL